MHPQRLASARVERGPRLRENVPQRLYLGTMHITHLSKAPALAREVRRRTRDDRSLGLHPDGEVTRRAQVSRGDSDVTRQKVRRLARVRWYGTNVGLRAVSGDRCSDVLLTTDEIVQCDPTWGEQMLRRLGSRKPAVDNRDRKEIGARGRRITVRRRRSMQRGGRRCVGMRQGIGRRCVAN